MSREPCKACGGPRRYDRKPPYCSKECEARSEGYSPSTIAKLAKKGLTSEILGTSAWQPDALDKVEHIVASRVGILSDLHIPIHSTSWLALAVETFLRFDVKHVILNGDVLDLNQISRHAGSYHRRSSELNHDLEAAEAVLKILSKTFDKITWLMGNHDMRLIHHFGGEVSVKRAFSIVGSFPNLKMTSRSFVHVNDSIVVCHPRQYSRIRGALAQKLSLRWQKSVATGHQHHACMTTSPCGKFQAVDIPCLAEIEMMDYVKNELTDHIEPVNGFGIIFGERIQVFDQFTPREIFKPST